MPERAEGPGTTTGAPNNVSAAGSDKASVPQQLRRRLEASYRLPPMPDGRRDPIARTDWSCLHEPIDWLDTGVFIDHQGSVKLISLRQYYARRAA